MRKSGIIIIFVGLGALLVALVLNKPFQRKYQQKKHANETFVNADFQDAEELFQMGHPVEALEIIHRHEDDLEYHSENGQKWVDLFIDVSTATRNSHQLVFLYEVFPEAFENNERAALFVADDLIKTKRLRDYEVLREQWNGREEVAQEWLGLDADRLLLSNQRREAIYLLKSNSFPGTQDTGRLIRLALLYVLDDPKLAWDYLTEAHNKDPKNADIHSYRARLLESIGKKSLALSEFIAAAQTSPNNLFLKDQLADFYLRNNQYKQAMEIWLDTLNKPTLDNIWVKVIFWNRLITPLSFDWSSTNPPNGKIKPYIEYLQNLKPGQYWDDSSFAKIPNSQKFLTSQQSTFWLRLLQNLKDGREKDALEILQFNPYSNSSWNPSLELAIKRVLAYRSTGSLNLESLRNPLDMYPNPTSTNENKDDNIFFNKLTELGSPVQRGQKITPIPAEIHDLLTSKEAFSAIFLAAGWYEAALQLHSMPVLPSQFPEWVSVGLTRALRTNRGNEEALTFATKQKTSQNLSLLIGELLAATKHTDSALEQLKKLSMEQSEIGARATWLISLIYIERGQYQEAKQAIRAQPLFANDTLGKETMARIAMLEGNDPLAAQLYSEIISKSSEAKSFLARKAFADKEWTKARDLTEVLLREYPDNVLLRENLKKIIDEQKNTAESEVR